jgi:uncharacterized damage-inducible protein DinB
MTTSTDLSTEIELPIAGSEIETLLGALDRNRRTFAWKCFGLSADEMRRTLGPSTMTLAGLVKHVALVEDYYFALGLGESMPQPWSDVDFEADPDWDWHSAAEDSPEELQALWEAATGRSRAAVAAFLAEESADSRVRWSESTEPPNLRRMLVDMVEEYARHTGHADLIRESIDGLVGEGLPHEGATA